MATVSDPVLCQIKDCRFGTRQSWRLKSGERIGLCLYHVALLLSMGYESSDEPPPEVIDADHS